VLLLFGVVTARITLDLLFIEIYRNNITLLQAVSAASGMEALFI